jgi:hypothetical protein
MGLQGTNKNINIGQMFYRAMNSDMRIGDYQPAESRNIIELLCNSVSSEKCLSLNTRTELDFKNIIKADLLHSRRSCKYVQRSINLYNSPYI